MINKILRFFGAMVLASAMFGSGEMSAQITSNNWSNATNGGGGAGPISSVGVVALPGVSGTLQAGGSFQAGTSTVQFSFVPGVGGGVLVTVNGEGAGPTDVDLNNLGSQFLEPAPGGFTASFSSGGPAMAPLELRRTGSGRAVQTATDLRGALEDAFGKLTVSFWIREGVITKEQLRTGGDLTGHLGLGDADNDGVRDRDDDCPDTPSGADLDAAGCPTDSDGDGVFDGLDRCADTPAGVGVNPSGCPMDSDGDGVFDGLDRCTDTPVGIEVDPNGCPLPEPEPEPEPQPEVFTFRGTIGFELGGTNLSTGAETALREIGEMLISHPGILVTLEGYADSVGNDDVNLRVSQQRALAVRNFLVGTFAELTTGQFTVLWYGEANPVADNGTAEGRAQNRRVVLKVGL